MSFIPVVPEFTDGLGRSWAYLHEVVQVWSPHAGEGRNAKRRYKTRYVDIGRVRVLPQYGWGVQRFDSLVAAGMSCTNCVIRGAAFDKAAYTPVAWAVPQAVKDAATWPGMTFRVQAEDWPFGLERVKQPTTYANGVSRWTFGITGAVWLLAHCGFPEERHNTLEAALAALHAR